VLQIVFPVLHIRAPKVVGLRLLRHLTDEETIALRSMGFGYLLRMPHVRANHGMLTALAERWHSEHNTFHLPTGEATITLEDVYRILRVPCIGEPVSHLIMCILMFFESFKEKLT
jgi:hypothetical protein